jgi:hypothetical protein
MKAADVKAAFPTEAALCEIFVRDIRALGGWTVYPETAGFDMLCVYDRTGHQLGIEAKLALNAKVADQITPDHYQGYDTTGIEGPDFRAVIVPQITEASSGIAKLLRIVGVQVWAPSDGYRHGWSFEQVLNKHGRGNPDRREYDPADGPLLSWDMAWHDWNPAHRCRLPEFVPAVACGVPSPIQLTPWKIGALRVLADLEVDGFVTARSVRAHGIDARRFCATDGWLTSAGDGKWTRGKLPAFDLQHPETYAQLLSEARAARAAAAA